jgi:hypothetical protein
MTVATIQAMEEDIRRLVQTIHDTDGRSMLVTAGAGTYALAWLLGVAGASRTLLEAIIPYEENAFDDFLGRKPARYVDAKTARYMAGRALTRARMLRHEGERVIGLACTATIVTDRPKRGRHRAHVATWSNDHVVSYHLDLEKGARDREGEETVVSRMMLNALARAYGLSIRVPNQLGAGDSLQVIDFDIASTVDELLGGDVPYVGIYDHGSVRTSGLNPQLLLSGSFNPLHEGHLRLAHAAAEITGKPVAFELTAVNADKPVLTHEALVERIAQFAGRWPIYATNAPTFVEKARLFPGTTFVVGYDTAARVLQTRFYGGGDQEVLAVLEELRALNCRFLVAGRVDDNDVFHSAANLTVPDGFGDLFYPILNFRRDISSSELRRKGLRGSR